MSKEEAIIKIKKLRNEYNDLFVDYCGVNEAVNMAIEALQAEPIRHGRWEWVDAPVFGNPYGSYKCDCGNYVPHKTNYCPYCGAKMEGEIDG